MASVHLPLAAQLTSKVNGIVGVETADEAYAMSASVIVKGSNPVIGTLTDENNRFSLNVPVGTQILEISLAGYETKRVEIIVRTGQTQ